MDEGDQVNSVSSVDENSLRGKIAESERVLVGLERDLQAIDSARAKLSEKNHQYEVLGQACDSLEELEGLGAPNLFWGETSGSDRPVEYLQNARRNIETFVEQVAFVEERRRSMVEKIGAQNEVLDYLDDDLQDAMEREEARKAEWLVEREVPTLPFRSQVMPWARGCEEDQRFRLSVAASLLVCMLLGVLTQLVDLPIPELSQLTKVPERVAKLIRQERTPPPPPVQVDEQIVPEEPEPDPLLAEETPPEKLPEATEVPVVAEAQQDVKEQVRSKGILAFRESFASRATMRPTAQLGSQARVTNAGQDAVGRPQRSMVTTSAPGSSGGINLAELSRDVGGGGQAIEGVEVTRVASSIGGDEGPDRPLSSGPSAGRTDEEIQIVFDRYKAALYRLYNRELRKNPTLRGQLVLRLTIEPNGTVSLCQLQNSDMDAPTLAQQVVERVSNFDFGAKEDIVAMTIIYPIDFLPAA